MLRFHRQFIVLRYTAKPRGFREEAVMLYKGALDSANLIKMSLVRAAVMLAICVLALAEATNTAEAKDSLAHDSKIAFVSERTGFSQIFAMRPDGTAITQLTNNTESANGSPSWLRDGSKIAFVREELYGEWGPNLLIMNADGSDQVQLRPQITDRDYDFNWSPDGSKIAFVRDVPAGAGGQVTPKIFIMNSDGTHQRELLPEPGRPQDATFNDYSPSWSPDGKRIAFVKSGTGEPICTVNTDGTGLKQLTRDTSDTNADPEWSPDGSRILFSRSDLDDPSLGDKYDVFVMNADGSEVENLTNKPEVHDVDATWSPDGKQIAFVRGDCVSGEVSCEIWRMMADGSSPTKLTNNTADDYSPVWQPVPSLKPPKDTDGSDVAQGTKKPGVEDVDRHRPERTVIVKPGDSLWSISEERLGPEASPQRVYDHTYRMYALNRNIIGSDPDLIFAGQRLSLPPLGEG